MGNKNIRILENEKVASKLDTHTLIADYEDNDIVILLETITDSVKEDNYFLYTVLGKEGNSYIIIDEIELENEIDGKTANNDLTGVDIHKELEKIAERFNVKC